MLKHALFLATCLTILGGTAAKAETKTALFAGGCFWCMESEFEDKDGVSEVVSGYAGGKGGVPTYEQVSTGMSGFLETVSVTYDPSIVTYHELLDIFWSNVDPFDAKGQFCDKGSQYAAAIFYGSPEEKALAEQSLRVIEEKYAKAVATQIRPASNFYAAEDYHQDYYKENALRYKLYRTGCGRDDRLEELKEALSEQDK